jgi:clan AA aspartic protease (TIGR02281 family)
MRSGRYKLAVIAAVTLLTGCAPQAPQSAREQACAQPGYPPVRPGAGFDEILADVYHAGCITREEYEANAKRSVAMRPSLAVPQRSGSQEIALQFAGRNIYVPVRVNGTITIPFMLDTGATELAIPFDVARTLARAGALDENDILDAEQYTLANGASQTFPRVVIRQVQVGAQTVTNVPALINPATSEPLLGQSFLARFGAVTIDYQRHLLVLSP